jgi:uncharacterized protein YhaN
VRLKGIEIERYGLLENCKIDSLAPGLNLVAGDNEAGKTTLLSFIRSILFGFSSEKKAAKNDYLIDSSDKLKGRLLVTGREYPEPLIIERHSGKGQGPVSLILPDGGRMGEDELARLLGNIDHSLYRNVFAFGLGELANLETLNSEQLKARIYSAGAGTGAVDVPKVLRQFDNEREDIFLPGGTKRQINVVLKNIQIMDTELNQLATRTDRYAELVTERESLKAGLEKLVQGSRENSSLLEHGRRLLSGREAWAEYCAAETHLSELDTLPEDFPVRAEERLNEFNERIRAAEEELKSLEHRLGEEKAGFVRQENLEKLFSMREKIVPVERGSGQFEKALDDLPKRKAELGSVMESLGRKLEDISPGWKLQDLLGFDNSIVSRDRYRALKQDIEEARLRLLEAEQSVRHAGDEYDRADTAFVQAENAFKLRYGRRVSLLRNLALPVSILALAVGVPLLLAGQIVEGSILGVLALALFGGWLWLRKSSDNRLKDTGTPDSLPGFRLEERRGLDETRMERQRREKQLGREKDEKEEARGALKEKQEEFAFFLEELGLEKNLSPEALGDVFSQVDLARQEHAKTGQLEERIGEIEGFIEEYYQDVCVLLGELGYPEPGRKETVGAVGRLLQDLDQARQYQAGLEKHEQNLKWLNEQIETQNDKLAELVEEKKNLTAVSVLETGETPDNSEERFLRHAQVAAEREIWDGKRKDTRSRLAARCGSPDKLEEYITELKDVSFDSLEEEIEILQVQQDQAEQEREELNRRLGENNKDLEQVSTETRAGEIRLERSVAVEQLDNLAERWAVLTLAAHTVRLAMEKYEKERQPEVLRHAEIFFQQMTAGRYKQIVNPVGEQRFEVCTARGRRLPPEKLSRGTAEQLYLALRLGLIEERSSHGEPVPVMMDDILVNFDPQRAAAACQAVAGIAKTHQVIYLTCHPHIVELFGKQAPGVNIVRLELP